jgi:hypothetical protein
MRFAAFVAARSPPLDAVVDRFPAARRAPRDDDIDGATTRESAAD